jgi:hypothetical protein
MSRFAVVGAYAALLAVVGALAFAGGMKVHRAHGTELDDMYVIRGTAEAIDHSRSDKVIGVVGDGPSGTPMLFKDEADCKAYTKTKEFADRTAKMAILMQTWHPPARLHQECVPLHALREREA